MREETMARMMEHTNNGVFPSPTPQLIEPDAGDSCDSVDKDGVSFKF